MFIQQISVFLENTPGRLANLTTLLGENGIDLLALSIADTQDFGVLRAIVNQTDTALEVLKKGGFTANATHVLAVEVPDRPAGLASVLCLLHDAGVGVEYMYSFVRHVHHNAVMIMRITEIDAAVRVFTDNQVTLLTQEQVVAL